MRQLHEFVGGWPAIANGHFINTATRNRREHRCFGTMIRLPSGPSRLRSPAGAFVEYRPLLAFWSIPFSVSSPKFREWAIGTLISKWIDRPTVCRRPLLKRLTNHVSSYHPQSPPRTCIV